MSSLEPQQQQQSINTLDIRDIQDRIGYVDTGPTTQQQPQQRPTVATSSTSHLIIKEPRPHKKIHIITDKKRPSFNDTPQEIQQESKISFQGGTTQHKQPRKTVVNTTNLHPVSQQQQPYCNNNKSPIMTEKGKEKRIYNNEGGGYVQPMVTSSSSSSSTQAQSAQQGMIDNNRPNREEIKEMMVFKLYELADMLKSLNIKDDQAQPRHTPSKSKSDPPVPVTQQQQVERRPSKGKMNAIVLSPENNRNMYNKSADSVTRYYPHHGGDYYGYDYDYQQGSSRGYHSYYDHQPYEEDYYNYYVAPPQRFLNYNRLQRKSYGNLRDEDVLVHGGGSRVLSRKNSRSNMRRQIPPIMYDPRYQPQGPPHDRYYPPPPPPQQYSSQDYYM